MGIIKTWEELEITDDFLFGKVMRNPEICKRTIEAILNIEVDHIDYPEEQKIINMTADAKSVRLDVYVKDAANTVYNIEMQPTKRGHLPKRSRYYQGMIDLELIEKGELYDKLKRSYVIFICRFDLFGKNRCIYTFENRCVEDMDVALGDETVKVFLNSKGNMEQIDENLKAFLKYVNNCDDENENDFVNMIKREVAQIKANKEWRREYMTLFMRLQENLEEGRKEGRKEGLKEGLKEGRSEGEVLKVISQIRKKLVRNVSEEDMADMLEEELEYIKKIVKLVQENPEFSDEQIFYKLRK